MINSQQFLSEKKKFKVEKEKYSQINQVNYIFVWTIKFLFLFKNFFAFKKVIKWVMNDKAQIYWRKIGYH